MILYHGTGHDFDRFEVRPKTGEGTNVFGQGIYLAEHIRVGAYYAKLVGAKTGRKHLLQCRIRIIPEDLLNWYRGGERVYRSFVEQEGSPAKASRRLAALGIPGIHYLDAHSRDIGFGTRNVLIFDPECIDILERCPI